MVKALGNGLFEFKNGVQARKLANGHGTKRRRAPRKNRRRRQKGGAEGQNPGET